MSGTRSDIGVPRALIDGWRAYISLATRRHQRLLLAIVYWAVLGPTALTVLAERKRFFGRAPETRTSYWLPHAPVGRSVTALRRQY